MFRKLIVVMAAMEVLGVSGLDPINVTMATSIGSIDIFMIITCSVYINLRRTFSTIKDRISEGYYRGNGLFGFKDLVGPRLELDFVLPFVKLPIFGVGPLIELDVQSITAAFTAIIFLYIVPKLLFLLYPNYQYPAPAATPGPDRGERSFDMPLYLNSIEDFLRTYVVPTDSCSSTNSSFLRANVSAAALNSNNFRYHSIKRK